ncbi:MAG: hypothetical protein ACI8XC_000923 [Gammaproteobacteria bacterium]|jgi:hypothetical protein
MSDQTKNNVSQFAGSETEKYSREDDMNFDRLMVFPDTRQALSAGLNEVSHEFIDASLNYSSSDNQAFEQLMNVSGLVKGSWCGSHSNGNSFLLDGYTDSDNGQFDEIESIISDSIQPSQDGVVPLEQTPTQNSTEYSLADKHAFSRLMLEVPGEDDEHIVELEVNKPGNETSHMKIIDFDKEKSREKSRSRVGQSDIKIRYFD